MYWFFVFNSKDPLVETLVFTSTSSVQYEYILFKPILPRIKQNGFDTFRNIDENDLGSLKKKNLSTVGRTNCTYLGFSQKEVKQ